MPGHKKAPSAKEQSTVPKNANKLAGAAILSAITAPIKLSNTANGFNSAEILSFLNMRFSDALTAHHDTNLDARPEKYECQENAWVKKASTQTQGKMINGNDFLLEMARCTN